MIEIYKEPVRWNDLIKWPGLPGDLQTIIAYFATCDVSLMKRTGSGEHAKKRCCELNWSVMVDGEEI
jgi:hypothetical protein